ncbi:MAG TPA: DUF2062 domain-containing protein [Sedimentisphaerales bacterium]|nr:DUF2062 domain-containing protein [Sedimentisphaerales bacterium]
MVIEKHERTKFENAMRFLKFRVLHVNDSPKSIAMGVCLGVFVAWTPILGVHMMTALFLAVIAKANKLVSVLTVWVSNPFTYLPMWSLGYMVGRTLTKIFNGTAVDQPQDITQHVSSFSMVEIFSRFFEIALWKEIASSLWSKGIELWIGCLILGTISAIAGYFLTYYLIVKHRKKNPHRRFASHL